VVIAVSVRPLRKDIYMFHYMSCVGGVKVSIFSQASCHVIDLRSEVDILSTYTLFSNNMSMCCGMCQMYVTPYVEASINCIFQASYLVK